MHHGGPPASWLPFRGTPTALSCDGWIRTGTSSIACTNITTSCRCHEARPRVPSCLEAGLCLCGHEGARTRLIKAQVLAMVSRCFNTKELRRTLSGCKAGIQVQGFIKINRDDNPHVEGSLLGDSKVIENLLFIGLQFWKPVWPTFRVMVLPSKPEGSTGELDLVATHMYMTLFQLADELNSYNVGTLRIRAFELVKTDVHVVHVDPTKIKVQWFCNIFKSELPAGERISWARVWRNRHGLGRGYRGP